MPITLHPFGKNEFYAYAGATRLPSGGAPLYTYVDSPLAELSEVGITPIVILSGTGPFELMPYAVVIEGDAEGYPIGGIRYFNDFFQARLFALSLVPLVRMTHTKEQLEQNLADLNMELF